MGPIVLNSLFSSLPPPHQLTKWVILVITIADALRMGGSQVVAQSSTTSLCMISLHNYLEQSKVTSICMASLHNYLEQKLSNRVG